MILMDYNYNKNIYVVNEYEWNIHHFINVIEFIIF